MYICVDFDGTIVDHRYPEIGNPVPNAIETLHKIQEYGHDLILFTMRHDHFLDDAVRYVLDQGIHLFGINENPTQDSWSQSRKVYGQIYIDDAAFGCPLIHPEGFSRPCVDWTVVDSYFTRLHGNETINN